MSNVPKSLLDSFMDWYLGEIPKIDSPSLLFHSFIEYLQTLGFQIIRGNMGTRTLHPQVETLAYLWAPKSQKELFDLQANPLFHSGRWFEFPDAFIRETKFRLGSIQSTQFAASPIQYVLTTNKTYYYRFTEGFKGEYPYPILEELAPIGGTGYFAIPVIQKGNSYAFLSLLTAKPDGFTDVELDFLTKALNMVALKWWTFIQSELTESLLSIYLGKRTGSTVYSGKIYLGELDKIQSVIWFSDIRNYSGMSEKLSPPEVIQLLNDYFGLAIPLIEAHGGEVLKLLGDGILAVFPYTESNKTYVGKKVLLAVRRLGEDLFLHNQIREKETKLPIHHGVGLHSGEILYGNIGSTERLDFTVIGEAVNLTSRIAGMCGELGKAVLASENLANQIPVRWEELGEHKLKGIGSPQKIFAISERLKKKY
ncbi:adenylate/guanylate cyclase domain-containing protein [Leptospira sp. 201903074]|uniref:adenylate/guanylate cyclase domain-containing protein n=1 Tax=Leptospira abararensis TaxID=2810036 RepID=UPI0019647B1F|nr:adenylate/guanylate cyclase domain-containing protein [Leptospira abararensis]